MAYLCRSGAAMRAISRRFSSAQDFYPSLQFTKDKRRRRVTEGLNRRGYALVRVHGGRPGWTMSGSPRLASTESRSTDLPPGPSHSYPLRLGRSHATHKSLSRMVAGV